MTRSDRSVAAVVEDDGRGFDGDATRDDVLGIVGMRERVGLVGGRLRVESTVGSGTTVAAEVPDPVSIRVLVVDDHAVVRAGLRRVLDAESDIETVGEAANADRAVFEAIEHKPDVVLMDVMMPGKSGIEGMPALMQAVPDAKVLILSMQDDPRYVQEAFDAGASGYVLKEAADTEVVAAVRAVAGGERYVHPALGARLVEAAAAERKRAEVDPLSEREREVLRLLALGHTNQEIAKMLYISVRTAETHRAHIMQKLGSRVGPSSSASRSRKGCSTRSDRPRYAASATQRRVDVAHASPLEPEHAVDASLLAEAVREHDLDELGRRPGSGPRQRASDPGRQVPEADVIGVDHPGEVVHRHLLGAGKIEAPVVRARVECGDDRVDHVLTVDRRNPLAAVAEDPDGVSPPCTSAPRRSGRGRRPARRCACTGRRHSRGRSGRGAPPLRPSPEGTRSRTAGRPRRS